MLRYIIKMNSKEYKKSLNKKVKDMTDEERKEYTKLRVRESRDRNIGSIAPKPEEREAVVPKRRKLKIVVKEAPAKKKNLVLKRPDPPAKKKNLVLKRPDPPPKKKNLKVVSKNVPNDKLKCFMLKAKNNGAMYRTCVTPEKKKQPKTQVRDDPIPSRLRKKPYIRAYPNAKERRKVQNQKNKAKKAKKD